MGRGSFKNKNKVFASVFAVAGVIAVSDCKGGSILSPNPPPPKKNKQKKLPF